MLYKLTSVYYTHYVPSRFLLVRKKNLHEKENTYVHMHRSSFLHIARKLNVFLAKTVIQYLGCSPFINLFLNTQAVIWMCPHWSAVVVGT